MPPSAPTRSPGKVIFFYQKRKTPKTLACNDLSLGTVQLLSKENDKDSNSEDSENEEDEEYGPMNETEV